MKTDILFGARLRKLRRGAEISQKQLGELLGISDHAISMIEKGTRSTTIEKLVLLAEYFRVSTDYLLGVTDDPAWRGGPLE